ncbi:MAG: NAD(P)-dependent oxidoreductase, partial [Acidimicrobiales bacterium]
MANDRQLAVGWVGTGVMGGPMCEHLLGAGHQVKVFTRTKERAQPLLEKGAQWCTSPADAARGMDLVVTMVGYPTDVEEVVLGEHGVLSSAAKGTTLVDMTTSEPRLAREIFEAAAPRGIGSLDAPVSG